MDVRFSEILRQRLNCPSALFGSPAAQRQNKSAVGRCPSGIAVSRKRGPSARICRQIDEPSVLPPPEGKIKTKNDKSFSVLMVPLVGVEPTRYRYHGILSPARLPIPPQRRISLTHSRSLPVYDNIS